MSGETIGVNVSSSQITDRATALPRIVAAPSTATSAGQVNDIAFDGTHFYACVATNTWVRATLATW
jgi:hypothetical protein